MLWGCIKILKEKSNDGGGSDDGGRAVGVRQSTVIRKAKELGLLFKGKSTWRQL